MFQNVVTKPRYYVNMTNFFNFNISLNLVHSAEGVL